MGRQPRIPNEVEKIVVRSKKHSWTLDDLKVSLFEAGIDADFSSIFRAVKKLVGEGKIKKLVLNDDKSHFEPTGSHHDHTCCRECGKVSEIPCAIVETSLNEIEDSIGFKIEGHSLVVDGICNDCSLSLRG